MAGKADIVNHLVGQVEGLTKKQATEVLDAIFGAIADSLARDDRVSIHAFGSFSVSSRAARQGRNPATGATIRIASSKNIKFKPAREVKDTLQSAGLYGDGTTDYPERGRRK